MDRYSAANALLIYSQYPQATQLKDFDDWGKDNVKITSLLFWVSSSADGVPSDRFSAAASCRLS